MNFSPNPFKRKIPRERDFVVGQRSEISNFYTDLKEVTNWGLKQEIPRKEREGE